MRKYLLLISLFCATIFAHAQVHFPQAEGERARYTASIEMQKAHISGICIMAYQEGRINGSLFNEFGISAMDFSYIPKKDKVKLYHVISMLNKWYIKMTLKKDLKRLIHTLQDGKNEYVNEKRHIKYIFTPLIASEDGVAE